MSATAWNGGGIGLNPGVSLFAIQENLVVEYRIDSTSSGGIVGQQAIAQVVTDTDYSSSTFSNNAPIAGTNLYDFGSSLRYVFAFGSFGSPYNLLTGIHNWYYQDSTNGWVYGGVAGLAAVGSIAVAPYMHYDSSGTASPSIGLVYQTAAGIYLTEWTGSPLTRQPAVAISSITQPVQLSFLVQATRGECHRRYPCSRA